MPGQSLVGGPEEAARPLLSPVAWGFPTAPILRGDDVRAALFGPASTLTG